MDETPDNEETLGEESEGFDLGEEAWDLGDDEASRILGGLEALIPGILKRSILSGLSALGDEGLRGVVGEKNIPKEAVGFMLTSADATRREILRIVSREIRVFLENMDFGGEISKILTTLSFEIRTEIRFVPNDEKVKPNIRNRVKLKRTREDGEVETLSDFEEEIDGDEVPVAEKVTPKKRRWSRKKDAGDEETASE